MHPGGALGPGTRDALDELRELEALLRNARIHKPLVLVGHSWGGPLVRLYAGRHRHDVAKSLREVATVATLGDLPLVVVTAPLGQFPPPADRYLAPVWARLQSGLARLSSRSVHVIALRSSHFVIQDQPDVVVAAVRAAVAASRDDGRLPPCARVFRMTGTRCVS